jgi:thymidine kinase
MFSGKTTEMLRRVRVLEIGGMKAEVVKHSIDIRYEEEVAEGVHRVVSEALDKIDTSLELGVVLMNDKKRVVVTHHDERRDALHLATLLPYAETTDADVVGIDEGQFFGDVVEGCLKLLERGKIVIMACLDGDYQKKPFGRVLELIPHADRFEKLNAICMKCKKMEAPFTSKNSNSNGEVIEVGGIDKYTPTCRGCFTVPETSNGLFDYYASTTRSVLERIAMNGQYSDDECSS